MLFDFLGMALPAYIHVLGRGATCARNAAPQSNRDAPWYRLNERNNLPRGGLQSHVVVLGTPDVEATLGVLGVHTELSLVVSAELDQSSANSFEARREVPLWRLDTRGQSMNSSASKALGPPGRVREVMDLNSIAAGDGLQHELRDAIANRHLEWI